MYTAPLKDMRFVLDHVVNLEKIAALPGFDAVTSDLVEAVLTEAGRLSGEVWAPTNREGDKNPPKIDNGAVKTSPGFKAAYTQFAQGGWNGLVFPEEFGGQGLPWSLQMAVAEMWQSSNLALSLCPLLTQAAIEAIEKHGTEEQKKTYLQKLITGEWTGTMNLTEPQAGTDLAAIRTVATKSGDHYLMKGQKIFITFGEHDFTPNIIHLVLARVAGLPEGNDGLGLFIVPKFMVNPDGGLGARNDVRAVSLEHKLGIHGSPTCVMSYGDKEGAIAYLVGEEGKGLRNMFTMMNNARISVGLQGVALAERAYQHALAYAKDRKQCTRLGARDQERVSIIEHADVRRMLLTMRATTEAARALTYLAGGMIDHARRQTDPALKEKAQARLELLTPLVKAWATDLAVENASIGLQIHGGMGFIEETGAAQHYRDARILPIYEGTNGIQSGDLVFRKVLRDKGASALEFIAEMKGATENLDGNEFKSLRGSMTAALTGLEEATRWMLENGAKSLESVAAGGVAYLRLFSVVAGGYMMVKMASAAALQLKSGGGDAAFLETKILLADFYGSSILPQTAGLATVIKGGHAEALKIANGNF